MFSDSPDEIQPWILLSEASDETANSNSAGDGTNHQSNCATWQLADGRVSVALFSSLQAAVTYQQSAETTTPNETWQPAQPSRVGLARLLIAAHKAGFEIAVLDPDLNSAKRYFQIIEVLRNLRTQLRG